MYDLPQCACGKQCSFYFLKRNGTQDVTLDELRIRDLNNDIANDNTIADTIVFVCDKTCHGWCTYRCQLPKILYRTHTWLRLLNESAKKIRDQEITRLLLSANASSISMFEDRDWVEGSLKDRPHVKSKSNAYLLNLMN